MESLNEYLMRMYYNSENNSPIYSPQEIDNFDNPFRYLTPKTRHRFDALLCVMDSQYSILLKIYGMIMTQFVSYKGLGKIIINYVGHWLELIPHDDEFVMYPPGITTIPKNDAAIMTKILKFYEKYVSKLREVSLPYTINSEGLLWITHDSSMCKICSTIKLQDITPYYSVHRPGIRNYYVKIDRISDEEWLTEKSDNIPGDLYLAK